MSLFLVRNNVYMTILKGSKQNVLIQRFIFFDTP
ncbi:hypothetical protein SAMN05192573_101228 [Mucilaginibacter gossypii]|uniref:Uncharacterized protein n=1 Tax=Mucilaginibacter gossypii TaxID=551996 RepID=A0A1G7NF66_9SPHI|nr:hypothetical protein SAMN05192573_101228 [Mucilaginibacter gossypii]